MTNSNAKAVFNVRLDRLNSAEKTIEEAEELLNVRREAFVKHYSPYSIDDEIEIQKRAYVHSGKRGKITRIILIKDYSSKWKWRIIGYVLKKDGNESAFKFKFDMNITNYNHDTSK